MASDGRERTVFIESTGETDRPRPALPFVPPGPLRMLAGRLATARLGLAATFEREIDAGRGFVWLPVVFGAGILVYLPCRPSRGHWLWAGQRSSSSPRRGAPAFA